MDRPTLVLLTLVLYACRPASPPENTRTGAPTMRAPDFTAATYDGCIQTDGQRPDTTIRLGTPGAERWRRAMAHGAEYRCVVHPSLTLRLRLVGDTAGPSLDS